MPFWRAGRPEILKLETLKFKDKEPKNVDPKSDLMVDAPAGAEAFASTEGHDSHHALVGVEKESVDTSLLLGIVTGTVVVVITLVTIAFIITDVNSRRYASEQVAATDYPELREVRAAAASQLTQYDVVDPESQTFRIPVEQAINLMANEQHQDGDVEAYTDEVVLLPSR